MPLKAECGTFKKSDSIDIFIVLKEIHKKEQALRTRRYFHLTI